MKTEKQKELEKYDTLECIYCDRPCKPVKVTKHYNVYYEPHKCANGLYFQFLINREGEFMESI